MGDFNLDPDRTLDQTYAHRHLATSHGLAMEQAGLTLVGPNEPTFRSHGVFNGSRRYSRLDLVYVSGISPVVTIDGFAATDHFPVMASFLTARTPTLERVPRRNLKRLSSSELCQAIMTAFQLNGTDIYSLEDVNAIHDLIVKTVTMALDQVAPVCLVPARPQGTPPLNLARDTLKIMQERDLAAKNRSTKRGSCTYKTLCNKAARLVKRDRIGSKLASIGNAGSNPKKLWSAAKSILGNCGPATDHITLPNGDVFRDKNMAGALNQFFVDKIEKLQGGIMSKETFTQPNASRIPHPSFSFRFPNEQVVTKIILGLKPTEAVGVDGIPVSVLKLGVPVLAAPIAHLVRRSLSTGKVPSGFRIQ